ncbi:MAG: peroxiredoxin family protein [Bryobacteraceae bacterium]
MRRRSFLALTTAAALPAAQVPRPAPDVAGKLANGEDLKLNSYRGKVVGLAFVVTTCPSCQNFSRLMQKVYQEYGPRGFQPLAVATNEMAHMLIGDFSRSLGLSFPVGYSSRDAACEFLQWPVIMQMLVPQLVFVDKKGVIRAHYPGGDKFFDNGENNMRAQLDTLLKEAAPPSARRK